MLSRKWPPLQMTLLDSPYDIWKITSKPEWNLENKQISEWQFSIHLMIFEKYSKPEGLLENNHPTECEFSIHLMIFKK